MESIGFVNTILLLGAALVIAGILSSMVASRFGAPLLLVFLVVGMLAGEDGPGGIPFSDYQLAYFIGSLALAVILFDGGLRTRIGAFRGALGPAATLATLGVLVTAAVVGVTAAFLFGLNLLEGLLVGAVVASTDAAAVFFLLRTGGLQLRQRVGATLEIESGTNDPVAVFLTILLVQLLLEPEAQAGWQVLKTLGLQAAIGTVLGLAGGFGMSWALNRLTLPAGLHPLFVVAGAVLLFALTALGQGSGFLAVYLAGLVMGNRPTRAAASILSFHDAATWLCQIAMFIVLGLLVTPHRLLEYALPALAIALVLMLVARPAAVWLCLWPFGFGRDERMFVSWVGLRGAVSIFLAAIPMLTGLPHAELYFNVAFFVVLVSLVVQGWSIAPAARRLGLALPGRAPSVDRVELDLPGQLDLEMVGYPVPEEAPILMRGAVPGWARLIFVVREGRLLDTKDAGPLRADDYAYMLVAPERVYRLDRLFAPTAQPEQEGETIGEFAFKGNVTLGTLVEMYGLDVPADDRESTLAQLFQERYGDASAPGSRLALGDASLVAREVGPEGVERVGLQIEELAGSRSERLQVRRDLATRLRALRRRWSAWRRRGAAPGAGT